MAPSTSFLIYIILLTALLFEDFQSPFEQSVKVYVLTTGLRCQNPLPVASVTHLTGSVERDERVHSRHPPCFCSVLEWVRSSHWAWGTANNLTVPCHTSRNYATLKILECSSLVPVLFLGPFHHPMVTEQLTRRALNRQQRNKPLRGLCSWCMQHLESSPKTFSFPCGTGTSPHHPDPVMACHCPQEEAGTPPRGRGSLFFLINV